MPFCMGVKVGASSDWACSRTGRCGECFDPRGRKWRKAGKH